MNPDDRYTMNPRWGLLMADMGVSAANVLRRAGLPRDLLSRPGSALSADEYYRLWNALDAEVGDPHLPLQVAKALSLEAFDPAIFAATCSKNLNVAARRIAEYKRLIGPTRLAVSISADETALEFTWPRQLDPPPSLATTELLFWVALVRLATRAPVRPIRVTSPDPPAMTEAYRDYLGIAIDRRSAHTIAFSAADAMRPFLTANEGMWEFFAPELRRRLSELEAGTSDADRVRALLLELLPTGEATMDAVGRELGVSPRTLQRRLKDDGTTFQQLLKGTRESLARHYLAKSPLPVTEISFLLGYEDYHSFYRAFHAWTGQTPQMARAAALAN